MVEIKIKDNKDIKRLDVEITRKNPSKLENLLTELIQKIIKKGVE